MYYPNVCTYNYYFVDAGLSVEVTSAITVYRQQVNVVHAIRLTSINHTGVHVAVHHITD